MDFSSNNVELWRVIIQFGIIAAAVVLATFLGRKLPFIRRSLMPTSVLAGILLLLCSNFGLIKLDITFLEKLTYHGIAIGFIAMSLRIPDKKSTDDGAFIGTKSGALIVSTYLVQAIIGLTITLLIAFTVKPDMFAAAGILLPMGFGQGPGQANNVGSSYEALGFAGGRSFGLSVAAAGYICACTVSVIYLNYLRRKDRIKAKNKGAVGLVTVDDFQQTGEIPVSESIDRFSMQTVLVMGVYFATYLVCVGIDKLIAALAPSLSNTVSPLLWGFNFIIGSSLAILVRTVIMGLRHSNIMTRQYQNNYLLSRLSGVAFDVMIIAGIASIKIEELEGLWLPYLLIITVGAIGTFMYLRYMCKRLYPSYNEESFVSMFGMLTGTISSGVLPLREIDPSFETPAANNLVIGSSFAILFGAPMLVLIGLAPDSTAMTITVLGLCTLYFLLLLAFILKAGKRTDKQ